MANHNFNYRRNWNLKDCEKLCCGVFQTVSVVMILAVVHTSAYGQQDRGLAVTLQNWSQQTVSPSIDDANGNTIVKQINLKPNQSADYVNVPRGSVLRIPKADQGTTDYPIDDISVRLTLTSAGIQPHERLNNPSDGGTPSVTLAAVPAGAPTFSRDTVKVINNTRAKVTGNFREPTKREGVIFLPGETQDFQIEQGKSYESHVVTDTKFEVQSGSTTYRFESSGPGTWTIRDGQKPSFRSNPNIPRQQRSGNTDNYTVRFVNKTGFDVKGVSSSTGPIRHLVGPMEVAPTQSKKLNFGGTDMSGRPLHHQIEFAIAKSWTAKPQDRAMVPTPTDGGWLYRIVINQNGKIVIDAKGVRYNGKYINPSQVESLRAKASIEPAPRLGFAFKATQRGGLTVTSVHPGSIADAMGLQAGQIIRMVNGFGVSSFEQLQHQLTLARMGNGNIRMSIQKPDSIYFDTIETWIKYPWNR